MAHSNNNKTTSPPSTPDYTTWTNPELIKRITLLETQLRAQTSTPLQSNKHAPKKQPKPFDPSKYTTRLIALKFAYLGAAYNGFEHHVNNKTPRPTIEEVLWRALRKTKLVLPEFKEGQLGVGEEEEEVCWEGCEYSKCGRTDRGVSAFGQVIGVRVRSSRPKERVMETDDVEGAGVKEMGKEWHHIRDELPYLQLLNRNLPADIRILAWCPNPPPDFSARFNCRERRYRYFFTNPAYMPDPAQSRSRDSAGGGWLDIEKMQQAAKKLEGLHDFRNLCKVDPSKQITNFERRIFSAGVYAAGPEDEAGALLSLPPFSAEPNGNHVASSPSNLQVHYFEVCGSAFLWHQVRHMVAILFLVGQGYEQPEIVDELLDVAKNPARPMYDMASDIPLVLWDCIFPALNQTSDGEHGSGRPTNGYEDAMDWLYVGDQANDDSEPTKQSRMVLMQDRKYGRLGIMEDLWAQWRSRKIEEVLAGSLMNVVARQGQSASRLSPLGGLTAADASPRLFDGSDTPRTTGAYIPVMRRERMEVPEVLNARYAVRKGLNGSAGLDVAADGDE